VAFSTYPNGVAVFGGDDQAAPPGRREWLFRQHSFCAGEEGGDGKGGPSAAPARSAAPAAHAVRFGNHREGSGPAVCVVPILSLAHTLSAMGWRFTRPPFGRMGAHPCGSAMRASVGPEAAAQAGAFARRAHKDASEVSPTSGVASAFERIHNEEIHLGAEGAK